MATPSPPLLQRLLLLRPVCDAVLVAGGGCQPLQLLLLAVVHHRLRRRRRNHLSLQAQFLPSPSALSPSSPNALFAVTSTDGGFNDDNGVAYGGGATVLPAGAFDSNDGLIQPNLPGQASSSGVAWSPAASTTSACIILRASIASTWVTPGRRVCRHHQHSGAVRARVLPRWLLPVVAVATHQLHVHLLLHPGV